MIISTSDQKISPLNFLKNPLFSVGWFALIIFSYFAIDKSLALFMHNYVDGFVSVVAELITQFGSAKYYLVGFPVLIIVAHFVMKDRHWTYRGWLFLLSVVVPGLICDAIKPVVGRSRPPLLFDQNVYGVHWFTTEFDYLYWSFPSGHATTISGVMTVCILLWPRWWKIFAAVLMLVSFSRVVVDAHFLSDVMAGMWLGAMVTMWIYEYFQRKFAL